MAFIGNRNHIEAYRWLPNNLKRELYNEFVQQFPKMEWLVFSRTALGRQAFGSQEWAAYIPLLEKYDKIWDEQVSVKRQIA